MNTIQLKRAETAFGEVKAYTFEYQPANLPHSKPVLVRVMRKYWTGKKTHRNKGRESIRAWWSYEIPEISAKGGAYRTRDQAVLMAIKDIDIVIR